MKPPVELEEICQDVKVCGRRELFALLKFRHKYQHLVDADRKKQKGKEAAEPKKELNAEELEAEEDKALEETIARVEKEKRKQEKKERERKSKAEFRAKMSVIASTDIYNQNDEVLFDKRTLEKIRKVDIEELAYEEADSEEEQHGLEAKGIMTGGKADQLTATAAEEDEDSDAESIDDETKRFEEMAAGIDEYYARQKEYMMEIDRGLQKKEKKRKLLIE